MLSPKLPDNIEDLNDGSLKVYDTILHISEFAYSGDKLEKTVTKDKKGNIVSEIRQVYKEGKRIKSMTYSFLGDTKYVSETTEYNTNDVKEADFLTTNPGGDTIGYKRSLVENNKKVVINFHKLFDMQNVSYFDETGQLIGTIDIDLKNNTKHMSSYKYDGQGNVIEETKYTEMLGSKR